MMMALGTLSFTACHEDKGNYDYRELVDFRVDQQGIPASITVTQFNTLNLPSRLVYDGNKEDLEFAWVVVRDAIEIGTTITMDTLATTENLAAPVPTTPGKYALMFSATERESRRSTFQLYDLTVEGAIGTGLLVLHEKDGIVDCDLIKTRTLVSSLDRDTVLRALYSRANPGYPLTGKPLQVDVSTLLPGNTYIHLFTDADGVRLSTVDMSLTHRSDELFFFAQGITAKPQGFYHIGSGYTEVLINNEKLYLISLLGIAFGLEKDALLIGVPGDYHAAPYVVQTSLATATLMYDQVDMCFYSFSTSGAVPIASTVPDNAFDFANVGKKMIYLETGFGTGRNLAIFKNPVEDGKRYLYVMNLNTANTAAFAANAAFDISSWPGIANANLFTFSTRGPVGFYATAHHVYRYTYDSNDFTVQPTAQEAWPYIPANETITALQLVKHAGINVPESTLDRFLLIGTYNETSNEGKVYVVEIDVVNGTCVMTPTAVYTGFGKVASMAFKPQ
jgi:hypothetical protein